MEVFVESYKALYKAMSAPDPSPEDFERWFNIATEACKDIEKILIEGNPKRGQKYSLETSLGHFITIQLTLSERIKHGGEIDMENSADLNDKDVVSSDVDEYSNAEVTSDVDNDLQASKSVKWIEVSSALQRRIKKGLIVNLMHLDYDKFMNDAKVLFVNEIKKVLMEFDSIKVNTDLAAKYVKVRDGEEEEEIFTFNTKNFNIFQTTDLSEEFENIRQSVGQQMSELQEKGSGWSLKCILHLVVNINKYNAMRVASYIPLPKDIKDKRACINVNNDDDKCFMWSVLAGLHKDFKNPQNYSHYKKYVNKLNFDGIEFPVKLKDIPKFEQQNDVSINCYILKKMCKGQDIDKIYHEVSPVHNTQVRDKKSKHINLLLIQDYYVLENGEDLCYNDNEDFSLPKYHYVLIKDISRLLRSQLTRNTRKCYVCDRCMNFVQSEKKSNIHERDCVAKNKCRIYLPTSSKDQILKFTNYNRKERVPVIIYADCESLLKPRDDNDPEKYINSHHLLSIGFYVKYSDEIKDSAAKSEYKSYRRTDENSESAGEWFIRELKAIAENLGRIYKNIQPMEISKQEEFEFEMSIICHICNRAFTKKDPKVRDHNHLSGK